MPRTKAKERPEKAASKRRARRTKGKVMTLEADTSVSLAEDIPAMSDCAAGTVLEALVLPESLDSASAGDIRELLLARRGSPLVVDAGQVRRTGMQAVQVLISAARTWQMDGQSYVVTNPTGEFLDTIALVGLTREHLLVEGFNG